MKCSTKTFTTFATSQLFIGLLQGTHALESSSIQQEASTRRMNPKNTIPLEVKGDTIHFPKSSEIQT